MTDEERKLMITIGSALTDLQKKLLPAIQIIIDRSVKPDEFGPKSSVAAGHEMQRLPVTSPADIVHAHGRPSVVSTVEHEIGQGLHKFKMDIVFDNASAMLPQQRMDNSIALLSEMEELLREYKVTSLTGTYGSQ